MLRLVFAGWLAVAAFTACKGNAPTPAPGAETPTPTPRAPHPRAETPEPTAAPISEVISVLVTPDHIWAASMAGGVYEIAACAGEPDWAGLVKALCRLRNASSFGAGQPVEIAGAGPVTHQTAVAAGNAAMRMGLYELWLVPPDSLAVQLPQAGAKPVVSDCDGVFESCARDAAHERIYWSPRAKVLAVKETPTITASRTEIALLGIAHHGDKIVGVEDVPTGDSWKIEALYRTLEEEHEAAPAYWAALSQKMPDFDHLAILQADRDLRFILINKILKTAREAGYTNIMFQSHRRSLR